MKFQNRDPITKWYSESKIQPRLGPRQAKPHPALTSALQMLLNTASPFPPENPPLFRENYRIFANYCLSFLGVKGKEVQPAPIRAPFTRLPPGGARVSRQGVSDGGVYERQGRGLSAGSSIRIFLPAQDLAEKNRRNRSPAARAHSLCTHLYTCKKYSGLQYIYRVNGTIQKRRLAPYFHACFR